MIQPKRRFDRRHFLGGAIAATATPLLAGCGGSADAGVRPPSGPPKHGGTLRVGVTGGGSSDTLDPHIPETNPDIARTINLYEPLLYRDHEYRLRPMVAESFVASSDARTWTATIRNGIRFSDGRPVAPEDVIATFRRITDPKDPKSGATGIRMLDSVVRSGPRSVEFRLSESTADFDDLVGQYALGIVPADFDLKNPVGTGPFKAHSFDPGMQSTFVRNPHYWERPMPYVDKLVLTNFTDDDARINALLSSQVDAIDQVPVSLIRVLRSDGRIRILNSETGSWVPFTMRVDRPPFTDVRVRQAMRLIVDREQMVNQVLSGEGRIGNDLYSPFDPGYASNLPQRKQNVQKVRSLLAAAGKPDLSVELVTSPIQAGAVEAAQVFQRQAKDAGVTVKLHKVDTTTFFGNNYLQWDFAQSFYYTRNYLAQVSNTSLPGSPYNETHFKDSEFKHMIEKAGATTDDSARRDLLHKAQRIEHERGGNIIWGFPNAVDAHQVYVAGLQRDRSGIALSGYQFRQAWLG